jgi:hypothetical protein
VLDLVVVGLGEDFPLIEWNIDHEETGKRMHPLYQSLFSPVLCPFFEHNEHKSHHRLLRSKSFGSKLVVLEPLQTPIFYRRDEMDIPLPPAVGVLHNKNMPMTRWAIYCGIYYWRNSGTRC